MRKRIVIGVLAVIGMGVLVYMVSQPRKGSIEWHKREYLCARARLNEESSYDRARGMLYRFVGRRTPGRVWTDQEYREENRRITNSQRVLISRGYLSERTLGLTNCTPIQVFRSDEFMDARRRCREPKFLAVRAPETNILVVVAAQEDMPIFVDAIRRMDVP